MAISVIETRFKRALAHLKRARREIAPLLYDVIERDNSDMFSAFEVRDGFRELRTSLVKLGLYQFGVDLPRRKA
jgi:hypothetical protein